MGRYFLYFLLVAVCNSVDIESLILKQVLMLSRHNLRTPLTATLGRMSSKPWPNWSDKVGYLTRRGILLEGYMGNYFSQWLNAEGLFREECPEEKLIHIYANSKQRTIESAKAFVKSAFRYCNVTVYSKNIKGMDPTFNPVIRNTSDAFKEQFVTAMQQKINETKLNNAYMELNNIIDIKSSKICKEDHYCNLANNTDSILYEIGMEPNTTGPLFIGSSIVDSFIMSYYEGFPLEDVAWGSVTTAAQWESLTGILRQFHNVRFNVTNAANNFVEPLLKYMSDIFLRNEITFTLLMGHDSNLGPVIVALDFEFYVLQDQYEPFPIGGKLVFQKWTDGRNDYLKTEYVYQSWEQLRNATKLSLENPPKKVTMRLKKCVTDENGFCAWKDFENILKSYI